MSGLDVPIATAIDIYAWFVFMFVHLVLLLSYYQFLKLGLKLLEIIIRFIIYRGWLYFFGR
jgi:hypothetical protein